MSRIITNNLRHNDATADNLTLDGTGNITAPGNLTTSGNLNVTGTTTLTNDLNVDSGTLFVDASTDRVGLGTTSPSQKLHVVGQAIFNNGGDFYINAANGQSILNYQNGALRIDTTSNEVARFDSSGYLRLSTASGGLQFNGDTAAANALDDYEEGSFTPTINSGYTPTYNQQSGRYIKIGKQVAFWIYLDTLTVTGSSSDTYAEVEGLPFTIRNSGILDTGFTVGWIYNLSNNVDHAYGNGNTTNIVLLGPNNGGFRTHWSPVQVWNNNDCRICLTGVYWTDS